MIERYRENTNEQDKARTTLLMEAHFSSLNNVSNVFWVMNLPLFHIPSYVPVIACEEQEVFSWTPETLVFLLNTIPHLTVMLVTAFSALS